MQIQALERNPGQEESIFDDLVQFASHQGILLPFGRPERTGDSEQEEIPLNSIVIENEQATDLLWEAIRSKLHKGIWTLLAKFPLCDQDSEKRKINLLYDLCFLYPADEIWKGYKNYRRKLMDQYVRNEALLEGIETDLLIPSESKVPSEVVSFVKLCRATEIMIHEDALILQEGIFPEKVPSFEFIHGTYLVKITQELQSVCESCEISQKAQEQGFLNEVERPSGTRRGSSVSVGKQSEERPLGSRRGSSVSSGKQSEEWPSGSRRGSFVSSGKQADVKENLSSYKHCFTAMIALERLVQKVISQRSDGEGTGEFCDMLLHIKCRRGVGRCTILYIKCVAKVKITKYLSSKGMLCMADFI